MKSIQPIVEGHGDIQAVPVLLRRILEQHGHFDVTVLRPHPRGDLPKIRAHFENYFTIATKEKGAPAILLLIDFDCKNCDCVVEEANALYAKAHQLRAEWPFKVAFMVKEFESLFLADPQTTRRIFKNIPESTEFPTDPEAVRDAKGWLSKAMPSGYAYKETVDQVKLAAAVDLNHLRVHSPSFHHLEKAVLALVEKLNAC